MARNDLPVLIAGGGIGGLSAALALPLKGRRVHVLEKAAEFGEIGYGIQMGPNVSRMLESASDCCRRSSRTPSFPRRLSWSMRSRTGS